ncbi:MAG: PAS domain S-box protein [Gammaproteobacteria bacterium]|nr:PAS domain S-box protein [Gammaproteobacteria bacterium]
MDFTSKDGCAPDKSEPGEAKFLALLDAAVDAIIVIDTRGHIEAFNASAQRLFGYSQDEVLGRNVKLLMPAPYHDAHDAYLGNYLESGQARIIGIGREVQARRRDGSVFPISLAVGEARMGKDRRFVGLIRDLSERKRAEEELQRAEDEARLHRERLAHMARLTTIGEMATGIAHEINQPLTAIATYAQACQRMLQSARAEPAELLEAFEKIEAQTQRASEVIRRLRSLIKQRESEKSVLDCNALVADVARLAEVDARIHDLGLVLELTPDLPEIVGDPIQIQQIVLNLIRNGLEAMTEGKPAHGSVHIRTSLAPEGGIEVRVQDWGRGMDEAQLAKLFTPFHTTKANGLGIGLCISRSIARAHGGDLIYCPTTEGGATFRLVLPALQDE